MNRRGWMLLAIVAMVGLLVSLIHGCGKSNLVPGDGVMYKLESFTVSDAVKASDGTSLPAVLVTFSYPEEGAEVSRRGTIQVPQAVMVKDSSLEQNRIIWETYALEGKDYRIVRWHAAYEVPSRQPSQLQEEEPGKK